MKKQASRSNLVLLAKASMVLVVAVLGLYLPQSAKVPTDSRTDRVSAAESTDVWWPTDGAHMKDTQPFKAMVTGRPVDEYEMYWQVDNGQLNRMDNNNTDYPHKEASVDLSGWNWRGSGPYMVAFRAKDHDGNLISEKSVAIWIDSPSASPATSSTPDGEATTTVSAPVAGAIAPPAGGSSDFSADIGTTATSGSGASATVSTVPAVTHISTAPSFVTFAAAVPQEVSVWWPVEGAVVSGIQPFKAVFQGLSVESYVMYWQVDGGQLNRMSDSYTDYPHKEAGVDLSSWTWRGAGPYAVNFIAQAPSGKILAQKSVSIRTSPAPSPAPAPTPKPIVTEPPLAEPPLSSNPLASAKLYVSPNSPAKQQADAWRTARPADAVQMDKIAGQPVAVWLGEWNQNVQGDTNLVVTAAQGQGAIATLIAYNIPQRDCGSYSAGGASSPDAYRSWIRAVANGINGRKTAVILEPDALANMDCLSSYDRAMRTSLLSDAVTILKGSGAVVYLDAGNSHWIGATEMANRLKSAGIGKADGFSLNVSNFYTDDDNASYGAQVSGALGGAHFVIDSSRNGLGSSGEWCNPTGRALGAKPTVLTGNPKLDARLWLKTPGESDGTCGGGPSAGTWWSDYALGLAQRAAW